MNASVITTNMINKLSKLQRLFVVASKSDSDIQYKVDIDLSTGSCPQGMNGSPCAHQVAVVKHYYSDSLNFVPSLHPSARRSRDIAIVALGDEAEKHLTFYSSLTK